MGCRKNDPECKSTTTATSKPKFFVTVVNAVVAGVLDTPLKLVTIKRNNGKIMSKATKI